MKKKEMIQMIGIVVCLVFVAACGGKSGDVSGNDAGSSIADVGGDCRDDGMSNVRLPADVVPSRQPSVVLGGQTDGDDSVSSSDGSDAPSEGGLSIGVSGSSGNQPEGTDVNSESDMENSCAIVYGDINGDKSVDVVDQQCLLLVIKWAMNKIGNAPPCLMQGNLWIADVDCDGVVGVTDYAYFLNYSKGSVDVTMDANSNGMADACEDPANGNANKAYCPPS